MVEEAPQLILSNSFPVGTMSTSSLLLYRSINSEGFRVISTMLALAVFLVWLYITSRTALGIWRGDILCVSLPT